MRAVPPAATKETVGPMEITGAPDAGPVRVLVVDDDRLIRWIIQQRLKDRGAIVTEAATAEEAMQMISRRPFELIVTDIVLPGADGLAVLAAAQVAQADAVVFLMTAHDEILSREEARKRGAAGLIIKRTDLNWVDEIIVAAATHRHRRQGSVTSGA